MVIIQNKKKPYRHTNMSNRGKRRRNNQNHVLSSQDEDSFENLEKPSIVVEDFETTWD